MAPPELTLIVAATRKMGIGANGSMPWTGLKKEMRYFARVTSHVPSQTSQESLNAVVMGRKTWDSIPPKFRPLKSRLNIVVSRSHTTSSSPSQNQPTSTLHPPESPVWVPSLEHALSYVEKQQAVSRVFVMGGAQIYDAALKLPQTSRILLTSIDRDFECDTFFGLELTEEGASKGWQRKSREELEKWTGEEVADDQAEEAGTRYEFQMWEKENR